MSAAPRRPGWSVGVARARTRRCAARRGGGPGRAGCRRGRASSRARRGGSRRSRSRRSPRRSASRAPSRSPRLQWARPSSAAAAPRGGGRRRRPDRGRGRRGRWSRRCRRRAARGRLGAPRPGREAGEPSSSTTIGASSRSSQESTISSSGSTPSASPVAMRAPTRAMVSTGRSREQLVGEGFEPAPQLRLLARPLHRRRSQFDQLRGALGSSPAMAWTIASAGSPSAAYQSLARRCSSATRSGCSSTSRARSTSPKRWW